MSKVITFSRMFPSYHPRKGQPTLFVEKILNNLGVDYQSSYYLQRLLEWNTVNIAKGKLYYDDLEMFQRSLIKTRDKKAHTIRDGIRHEQYDYFSPRVWAAMPYNSPQIIFYRDLRIQNMWLINHVKRGDFQEFNLSSLINPQTKLDQIARNDGLEINDFLNWFNKPMFGQIICWDKEIQYK